MKKILLAVAALAVTAGAAHAVGVTGTAHDLSASGALTGASADQKCVYCHTPHNGTAAIPLWNRNANAAIAVYNSTTLTTVAQNASIGATTVSGFCMSCHDGATSMGDIKNAAGGADNSVNITNATGGNLTQNLATTHPVGFNYDTAVGQDAGGLKAIATVKGSVLGTGAFFGASTNDMECATCHKVHDNTISPFLRVSNAGSNLCLECHNK